jgi:hypothetical protein
MKTDEGLYAVSIRLRFMQKIAIVRKPTFETLAATWEVTNLVVVGKANLRQVKDQVGDGVDYFANDFLSVNPKP